MTKETSFITLITCHNFSQFWQCKWDLNMEKTNFFFQFFFSLKGMKFFCIFLVFYFPPGQTLNTTTGVMTYFSIYTNCKKREESGVFLYLAGGSMQGILKGEVSPYHWPPVWLVWNRLYDKQQFLFLFAFRLIQTSQTGDQWYSDTSPFSIPCFMYHTGLMGVHTTRYSCTFNPKVSHLTLVFTKLFTII